MIAETTGDGAYVSQRSIYDERYQADQYDHRSAVRVLTAERDALAEAMGRALKSNPRAARVSLFDFGYGTGRVTNELIERYAQYGASYSDLRVVAYDVSSVGLRKAQAGLCLAGFEPVEGFSWEPDSTEGYIAGSVYKKEANLTTTVVFVHGYEGESPDDMRRLALTANDGDRYLLTTSWYSGLGHVPGEDLRRNYFRQLGELTHPAGEIVLAMSSTGDLVDLQRDWSEKLASGTVGDFPIEVHGDVVYSTELDQSNFYHVFGPDLNDYMQAVTSAGQYWWVEGIRYPDEEFESWAAEQANYKRVLEANDKKRGRAWVAADFREFHTVAAFRSPMDPVRR
jgi:SAM-dependent methyltransferase